MSKVIELNENEYEEVKNANEETPVKKEKKSFKHRLGEHLLGISDEPLFNPKLVNGLKIAGGVLAAGAIAVGGWFLGHEDGTDIPELTDGDGPIGFDDPPFEVIDATADIAADVDVAV